MDCVATEVTVKVHVFFEEHYGYSLTCQEKSEDSFLILYTRSRVFIDDGFRLEDPKEMTEEEYREEVLRTYAGSENHLDKLCLGALGLTGEAGEVADIIKKVLFHGHSIDGAKLCEELGDLLWYFILICDTLGYSLEDIMMQNTQKLRKRYPNGFDTKQSLDQQ